MISAQFSAAAPDSPDGNIQPILQLTVAYGQPLRAEGDPAWLDFTFQPISRLYGRPITWEEDCEEWVRALVEAYEHSPMQAEVISDTNPRPSSPSTHIPSPQPSSDSLAADIAGLLPAPGQTGLHAELDHEQTPEDSDPLTPDEPGAHSPAHDDTRPATDETAPGSAETLTPDPQSESPHDDSYSPNFSWSSADPQPADMGAEADAVSDTEHDISTDSGSEAEDPAPESDDDTPDDPAVTVAQILAQAEAEIAAGSPPSSPDRPKRTLRWRRQPAETAPAARQTPDGPEITDTNIGFKIFLAVLVLIAVAWLVMNLA
jgi:hypothetical protein